MEYETLPYELTREYNDPLNKTYEKPCVICGVELTVYKDLDKDYGCANHNEEAWEDYFYAQELENERVMEELEEWGVELIE